MRLSGSLRLPVVTEAKLHGVLSAQENARNARAAEAEIRPAKAPATPCWLKARMKRTYNAMTRSYGEGRVVFVWSQKEGERWTVFSGNHYSTWLRLTDEEAREYIATARDLRGAVMPADDQKEITAQLEWAMGA